MRVTRALVLAGVPVLTCLVAWATQAPSAALPAAQTANGRARSARPVVYAASGAELIQFDVDVAKAALRRRGSVTLHAHVQEAALHPSGESWYVASSDGGPTNAPAGGGPAPRGSDHRVTAFRIDPISGALTPHGAPATLPSRPIHVTTDRTGTHVLTAFNDPSGVTVHRLRQDGAIGEEVRPPDPLDAGIYGHQVRVAPSNRTVILVTRGNGPTATRPEDPGALKVFDYTDGRLTARAAIAPAGGFGFQARHLDFHPARPWLFLTLERQNTLQVYQFTGSTIAPDALFTRETLNDPRNVRPGQTVSTIHVHPNGRFVYLANRAAATTDFHGAPVWAGGENSIAVFAVDQDTGEPSLIQHVETRGFTPRTFAMDDAARILVVGNQHPLAVRDGTRVRNVPASLSVFRIRADGMLDFSKTYGIDVSGGRSVWWVGMASLGR